MSVHLLFPVTLAAMRPLDASPTLLPSCAIVLKTPPANACVFAGNTDIMTKFDTVNKASAPTGMSRTAGKAQAQYDLRMQSQLL